MCTCGISRRNLQERLNSMRSPVYRHLRGCPLAVWSCACRGAYLVCVWTGSRVTKLWRSTRFPFRNLLPALCVVHRVATLVCGTSTMLPQQPLRLEGAVGGQPRSDACQSTNTVPAALVVHRLPLVQCSPPDTLVRGESLRSRCGSPSRAV